MIKVITFDFWYTLYRNQPVNYDARTRQLQEDIHRMSGENIALEHLQKAINIARASWDQAWQTEHRTMGAREWILIVMDTLDLSIEDADLAAIEARIEYAILDHPPILTEDAKVALPKLAEKYRLAIISDTGLTPGRALSKVLERDGILPYFSHLTYSDELGSSKPHPNNFLATLNALEAQPHEGMHIGDLLRTDIAGARGVGMRGIQYVGMRHDDADQHIEPDAVIASHEKLFELLSDWG